MTPFPSHLSSAARLATAAVLVTALPGQPIQAPSSPPRPAPAVVVLTIPNPLAEQTRSSAEFKRDRARSIASFARKFIRPALAEDEDIKSLGKRSLVALVRPKQHAWLQELMTRFERSTVAHTLYHVECKFYEVSDQAYHRAVLPLLRSHPAPGRHAVLASNKKTQEYLDGLEKLRGTKIVHAPRVATLPITETSMSIAEQTAFVEDFRPTFDARGKLIAVDPVVDTVHDGMLLKCTCGLLPNGSMGVDVLATVAELQKPMPRVPIRVQGWREKLEIQIPKVDHADVTASIRMPIGGAVLFELPDPKRHLLVALRLHAEEK